MSIMSRQVFPLITALLVCGCSKSSDAPMFRGNLARTGVYKTKAVKKLTNLKWKFKTENLISASGILL